LKRAGLAYVEFALRRSEHFTVMFDAPVSKRKHPDFAEAAEQAFGTLLSSVKTARMKDDCPPEIPISSHFSRGRWCTESRSWRLPSVSHTSLEQIF
jgi:hypothetical protein